MITRDCSLQVFGSVSVRRCHIGEAAEVCSRTGIMSISRHVHPIWARSVDQRGTLRHLHERFLVDGVLSLWRQTHMKYHELVIEQVCRDLVVRFDRHAAGQATIFARHLLVASRP